MGIGLVIMVIKGTAAKYLGIELVQLYMYLKPYHHANLIQVRAQFQTLIPHLYHLRRFSMEISILLKSISRPNHSLFIEMFAHYL